MKTGSAGRALLAAGVTALFMCVPADSYGFGAPNVQLNPALQSLGYFGTGYPSGAGYYGGYTGSYHPYQGGYRYSYQPTDYSPYRYSSPYYTPYSHGCSPRRNWYQPLTTMVPTELTRHPPRMANPWFTSPDYRARHGFSGR